VKLGALSASVVKKLTTFKSKESFGKTGAISHIHQNPTFTGTNSHRYACTGRFPEDQLSKNTRIQLRLKKMLK
jgi:tRNA(Arg) A34 adenosine deaminase TadA